MPEQLFQGLFDSDLTTVISVTDFLLCLGVSLVLGLVMAIVYMIRTRYTKSFVVTLALLPAVVCVVIMLVNGNVGTGVAVAGAFGLVRFRSVPGTAKEICTLFLAMGAGLITGMGYLGFAVLFTVIMCAVFLIYNCLDLGAAKNAAAYKTFNITIPEDLDYTGVFDDIFQKYTSAHELACVKTTNMGSMFRLTYHVTLRDISKEKEMIDDIRCRNGNLEIAVSKQENHGVRAVRKGGFIMMKRWLAAACTGILILGLLGGCGKTENGETNTEETDSGSEESAADTAESTAEADFAEADADMFTERDYDTDYDEASSVSIRLNGSTAEASSDSVQISGGTVTITEEATYIISGTLDDGMIIVDAPDTAKLQLVLDGAEINSSASAPLYILEADKVFVTLAEGSENTLSNGGSFTAIDENNIDSVIFSKQDLTLNGSGSLTVTSPAGHGIVSKDDLVITGGTYVVTSASHALDANDSVRITGETTLTADAGKDGIHAENNDDTSLGFVYISGGGTDSSGTQGGRDAMFGGGGPGGMGGGPEGSSSSNGSITISGGTLYVNASGDGMDANGSLTISGGYTVVTGPTQGDTATLDYDSSAVITGGTFIGTGASGMAQTFSDSEQGVIAVTAGNQNAGTEITVTDQNGSTVISWTPELSFNVIIISSPDIVSGETYTVTAGTVSGEIQAS